jgi:hypothetical protein
VTIWVVRHGDDLYVHSYRSKYQRYGGTYVEPMVSPAARATTLRLVPA